VLNLQFRKIKPEREGQLRAWFAELSARAAEVRATFRDEGVQHEQAFILPTAEGPVLVWAGQLNDPDQASRVFARSSHAIDIEHERVLSECLDGRIALSPVYVELRVSSEHKLGDRGEPGAEQ
jgi:hypothetical protein